MYIQTQPDGLLETMNLRAAKNELGEPPRVGLQYLLLEAAGLLALCVIVVGFLE